MTNIRSANSHDLAEAFFVRTRRVLESITAVFMPMTVTPASVLVAPYSVPRASGSSSRAHTTAGNLLLSVPVGSERSLSPELVGGSSFAQVFSDAEQDNSHRKGNMLPCCFIRIGSRRTAIRVSHNPIICQVQRPFSKFVLRVVGFLVAHVINHMSEITQHVGNISKLSEFLSKAKNGRIGHVRYRNRRTLA